MTFSGGESADLTRGQFDRQAGTLTYRLSQPSRVLFRAGTSTGMLLKTVVDWEPRSSGTITEYWNGKDDDGLFDVPALKGTTMVLTYMTLSENSVITVGNDKPSFRVKSTRANGRSKKIADDERPQDLTAFPEVARDGPGFKVNILFPDADGPNRPGPSL